MKRHAQSARGGPLCGTETVIRPAVCYADHEADCGLCRRLLEKAKRAAEKAGPVDRYQGLSEAARSYVGSRQGSLRRLCECPGLYDVSDWYTGRAVPSYEQVRRILADAEPGAPIALDDFGYVRLPDGRVARLLKTEGNAP